MGKSCDSRSGALDFTQNGAKASSECQFCGQKHLVDKRDRRRMLRYSNNQNISECTSCWTLVPSICSRMRTLPDSVCEGDRVSTEVFNCVKMCLCLAAVGCREKLRRGHNAQSMLHSIRMCPDVLGPGLRSQNVQSSLHLHMGDCWPPITPTTPKRHLKRKTKSVATEVWPCQILCLVCLSSHCPWRNVLWRSCQRRQHMMWHNMLLHVPCASFSCKWLQSQCYSHIALYGWSHSARVFVSLWNLLRKYIPLLRISAEI